MAGARGVQISGERDEVLELRLTGAKLSSSAFADFCPSSLFVQRQDHHFWEAITGSTDDAFIQSCAERELGGALASHPTRHLGCVTDSDDSAYTLIFKLLTALIYSLQRCTRITLLSVSKFGHSGACSGKLCKWPFQPRSSASVAPRQWHSPGTPSRVLSVDKVLINF